jgi:hypothetical protein
MDQELDPTSEAGKAAAALSGGVPKNFRQQADMEAFYRFVHENDLREDALGILDSVRAQKAVMKAAKKPKH